MKYVLCLLAMLLGLSLHAQQPIDTTPPEDITPVEEEPAEEGGVPGLSLSQPGDQEDDQQNHHLALEGDPGPQHARPEAAQAAPGTAEGAEWR